MKARRKTLNGGKEGVKMNAPISTRRPEGKRFPHGTSYRALGGGGGGAQTHESKGSVQYGKVTNRLKRKGLRPDFPERGATTELCNYLTRSQSGQGNREPCHAADRLDTRKGGAGGPLSGNHYKE